eukprot:scaffold1682_cov154-Skeletonema_marinoi.AAC.3
MAQPIEPMAMDTDTDDIAIILVPLKDNGASVKPAPTHIDTTSLSKEGLEALRKHDPFLYYSIPGVRTAACLNERVVMSPLKTIKPPISVERRSCVSVECDILQLLRSKYGDERKRKRIEIENRSDAPVHTRRQRRWSFTYGAAFQQAF